MIKRVLILTRRDLPDEINDFVHENWVQGDIVKNGSFLALSKYSEASFDKPATIKDIEDYMKDQNYTDLDQFVKNYRLDFDVWLNKNYDVTTFDEVMVEFSW